jgi:hypothetical protein
VGIRAWWQIALGAPRIRPRLLVAHIRGARIRRRLILPGHRSVTAHIPRPRIWMLLPAWHVTRRSRIGPGLRIPRIRRRRPRIGSPGRIEVPRIRARIGTRMLRTPQVSGICGGRGGPRIGAVGARIGTRIRPVVRLHLLGDHSLDDAVCDVVHGGVGIGRGRTLGGRAVGRITCKT